MQPMKGRVGKIAKKPVARGQNAANGRAELPYQEPHGIGAAHGKLLEESIGREVRRFREKLGLTHQRTCQGGRHVGGHAVEDRERRHLAVARLAAGTCRAACMCR